MTEIEIFLENLAGQTFDNISNDLNPYVLQLILSNKANC
jgi:hypothetical protein